jgi:plasmid stabilization system protein ParE
VNNGLLQVHPEVEETDLAEIIAYIAADNPVAADAVYEAVSEMFALLADDPMMGTAMHPVRRSLRGVRMIPVTDYRNYLIYYVPLPHEAGVRILYVLHATRDASSYIRDHHRR